MALVALRTMRFREVILFGVTCYWALVLGFGSSRLASYALYWSAGWARNNLWIWFWITSILAEVGLIGWITRSQWLHRIWIFGEIIWWLFVSICYLTSHSGNPNAISPVCYTLLAILAYLQSDRTGRIDPASE